MNQSILLDRLTCGGFRLFLRKFVFKVIFFTGVGCCFFFFLCGTSVAHLPIAQTQVSSPFGKSHNHVHCILKKQNKNHRFCPHSNKLLLHQLVRIGPECEGHSSKQTTKKFGFNSNPSLDESLYLFDFNIISYIFASLPPLKFSEFKSLLDPPPKLF